MAPAGWRVVVPDDRLAPESPCPAGADGRAEGDNATDRTGIVAAICISPWVDGTCSLRSHRTRLEADTFARLDDLPTYAAASAGSLPLTDPLACDAIRYFIQTATEAP